MEHADMVLGQFSASNDKVAEAIKVVQEEWGRLVSEGVTPEELETTKTYLTGSYPLRFDGNGPIASILAVSYTHLDVYKRQHLCEGWGDRGCGRRADEPGGQHPHRGAEGRGHGRGAVSYTHLDVYKRQGCARSRGPR